MEIQKAKDYTLIRLKNTYCFVDDIVNVSKGSEDHQQHVCNCLNRLDEEIIFLNVGEIPRPQRFNRFPPPRLRQPRMKDHRAATAEGQQMMVAKIRHPIQKYPPHRRDHKEQATLKIFKHQNVLVVKTVQPTWEQVTKEPSISPVIGTVSFHDPRV